MKITKDEVVKIRVEIDAILGYQRGYKFWHNVVLKTPEAEFIEDL